MLHTYTDDGRIITPPKELKPLLKDSFSAFEKILGHIRFFYMADELWDGKSLLVFNADGAQLLSISLTETGFFVRTESQEFHIVDEALLYIVYNTLKTTIPIKYHRPPEQLTVNPNGPFCGFRCDMCLTNQAYNKNDYSISEKFDYMNWLCYRHCIEVDMDSERNKYTKAACPGCDKIKSGNCESKYLTCSAERGYANCADCGGYYSCDNHKNSHYPAQCNLGLIADEVTSLVVPYAMKERLDFFRNTTLKEFIRRRLS